MQDDEIIMNEELGKVVAYFKIVSRTFGRDSG
jgi:hypothetical protein